MKKVKRFLKRNCIKIPFWIAIIAVFGFAIFKAVSPSPTDTGSGGKSAGRNCRLCRTGECLENGH